ncbi:Ig-like domain-containing protein [Actinocorallia herbida]|uniref:Ig-like domain-containing protein n=1 Tax=Actinocorallia herbida TaxID=58109 RepID=A0A3N1DAM3_9ACTN|nr:NBR1-Ig-like domain-containing protein [Actinocorallia herbida]ROO90577.1 Ig-like domain-containing protein [Actinocorallia herbida]
MDDRRAQAEAIEGFAKALRELRDSVGNPPFREMSGRSGAISHTTLHEATKGNRLPSWGTTVEFVKACGADPAAYRDHWERANRTFRPTSAEDPPIRVDGSVGTPPGGLTAAAVAPQAAQVALAPLGETGASVPAQPPPPDEVVGRVPAPRGPRRFRPALPTVLAAAAVCAGAVILVVAVIDGGPDEPGPGPSADPAAPALTAADCPVTPTNPPSAPPANKGDASIFVGDLTLPDCTHVGRGQTVTKIWQIKNVGTVPWRGYSLRRLDQPQRADQCQTIPEILIKDTLPGEIVDIETEITTPKKPGLCYVRFKMANASGKLVFPGSRPVNFQIIVD